MIPRRYFSVLAVAAVSFGQTPRSSWSTFGADPQRTGWNRSETDISPETAKDLKLEWSLKLDAAPRALAGLTAPIARVYIATDRGVKDLVFVAGAEDILFAIDADTGKIFWRKTILAQAKPERAENWLCPNNLNATPVFGPAPAGSPARTGQALYTLGSDGRLDAFNVVTGEELIEPLPFVPAFSKSWSQNVANNSLYTTTSQGCNGVKSGVWGVSLNDAGHKTAFFQTGTTGSGIWGRGGSAITSTSNIVVATGDGNYDPANGFLPDSVLILSPRDLKLVDYYTAPNRVWLTRKDLDMGGITPVVFSFGKWELAAASGKEGVIVLVDSNAPGGPDHHTPLYRSPMYTNEEVNFSAHGFWGAFSTWEEPGATRWLYAPAWGPPAPDAHFPVQFGPTPHGSVMAFKVELKGDRPVLTPSWNSLDMSVPAPVAIANGIVYALSDGDNPVQFRHSGGLLNAEERKAGATHSILYALDARTGKVLFSSGDTIKGFSHFSAPAVAGGRVYVVTLDGTVYAFSLGSPQAAGLK